MDVFRNGLISFLFDAREMLDARRGVCRILDRMDDSNLVAGSTGIFRKQFRFWFIKMDCLLNTTLLIFCVFC